MVPNGTSLYHRILDYAKAAYRVIASTAVVT